MALDFLTQTIQSWFGSTTEIKTEDKPSQKISAGPLVYKKIETIDLRQAAIDAFENNPGPKVESLKFSGFSLLLLTPLAFTAFLTSCSEEPPPTTYSDYDFGKNIGKDAASEKENNPPVFETWDSGVINEGELFKFTLPVSDPDGDDIEVTMEPVPGVAFPEGAVIEKGPNGENIFVWTPNHNQAGLYRVAFVASDGTDQARTRWFITVKNNLSGPADAGGSFANDAPVLTPIGNKTAQEHSLMTFVVYATDPDEDSLTYGATHLPSGATFTPSTRTFKWTPGAEGLYQGIIFSVSDGKASDSETISINVKNVIFDADGDGFKEDVDCDDNDPNTIPLKENGGTTINKSTNICEGTYNSAHIIISGNYLTVKGLGFGAFLQKGYLYIKNLSNSSVSKIHVLDSSGFDSTGFGLYNAIEVVNSDFNNLKYLTGDCDKIACSMAIFLSSSNGNIISYSTFSDVGGNGCGIVLNESSSNNKITFCTFKNNDNDMCDSGNGNTFSGNTYQ